MSELNEFKGTIKEFYNFAFIQNAWNSLTPRNKFRISWTDFGDYKTTLVAADFPKTLRESINKWNPFINNIDVPSLVVSKEDKNVDDGRGTYFIYGDQMMKPENNEITLCYHESQASVADLFSYWMYKNSTPWVRPVRMNLNIDYIGDFDGETAVASIVVRGCAPTEVNQINASFEGKEILLRTIKMGFNSIKPRDLSNGATVDNGEAFKSNFDRFISMNTDAKKEMQEIQGSTSQKDERKYSGKKVESSYTTAALEAAKKDEETMMGTRQKSADSRTRSGKKVSSSYINYSDLQDFYTQEGSEKVTGGSSGHVISKDDKATQNGTVKVTGKKKGLNTVAKPQNVKSSI